MQYIIFDLEFNQDPESLIKKDSVSTQNTIQNPDLTANTDSQISLNNEIAQSSITNTDCTIHQNQLSNQNIVKNPDTNHDKASVSRAGSNNMSPKKKYLYEIIQIGAVKLDGNLKTTDTFNRLIKPSVYACISPHITELTGITLSMLQNEKEFRNVYDDFIKFIGDEEAILVVWGIIDILTLYKNIKYHNLDENLLPNKYINIQPITSVHLGQSKKRLLNLKFCADALGIEINTPFHDALNDALYTAEIFKKVFNKSIEPKLYNPSKLVQQSSRPVKRVLDFPKLIAQFNKMYAREMTAEEKEIIRLAYHMGKTGQFLKNKKAKELPDD